MDGFPKQLTVFLLIFLFLITLSCGQFSNSEPPIDAVQNLFAKKYIRGTDNSNLYKIIKFSKTNSYKQNILGIDATVFQYNAVVEIINDCYFYEPKGPELNFGYYIDLRPNKAFSPDNVRVKKGKIVNIQGELPFTKAEKGWQYIQ